MNTLYVSDLDGTLLTSAGRLSEFAERELNRLIAEGLNFSIATARSAATAVQLLENINFNIPVIFMNGVVLYDMERRKFIAHHDFDHEQSAKIIDVLTELNAKAFVYTIVDGEQICYSFDDSLLNEQMIEFKRERVDDFGKRFETFEDYAEMRDDVIIYFNLIGTYYEMSRVEYELYKIPGIETILYKDVYTGDWLLEVHKAGIDKGFATVELMRRTGADKLVVFADNTNDLPMIYKADYSYGVADANVDVYDAADEIIGSNEDDAVVKKLLDLAK